MDPGWRLTWTTTVSTMLLLWKLGKGAADTASDQLLLVRNSFLGFCAAQIAVGLVAVTLGDLTLGSEPIAVSATIVGVFGSASLVASTRIGAIDCSTSFALAHSYRSRYFVRAGLANAPALAGFALGTSIGPWWIYFAGAALSATALVLLAPSVSRLANEDANLQAQGCRHSLVPSLLNPTFAGAPT